MNTYQFLGNESRSNARVALCKAIWDATYSHLIKYGITSYREITNVDLIGIPVWIAQRPSSHTISVTAGKNLDRQMAMAGSIAEAIEFWAAENVKTRFYLCGYRQLAGQRTMGWLTAVIENKEEPEILPLSDYPLARDNILDEDTPIAWEIVHKLFSDKPTNAWMPTLTIVSKR